AVLPLTVELISVSVPPRMVLRPPPLEVAVLPLAGQLISVVERPTPPGVPPSAEMPPPFAGGVPLVGPPGHVITPAQMLLTPPPSKGEVLPLMVHLVSVAVPLLKTPPPPVDVPLVSAVLPVMTQSVSVTVPPLRTPPPLFALPLVIVSPEIEAEMPELIEN